MIPKVIHYCWFGGNPIPKKDIRCIESWKKYCPDYEIKEWNESNYDIHKNKYMEQAYEAKKWGFVPDFARLDIIFEHGGIYLDTDVEIIRNIDDLLEYRAFMGFEDGQHVAPGLFIGAEAGHPAIQRLMNEIYGDRVFLKDDGTCDLTASPVLVTDGFLRMGLVKNDKMQCVSGITIFPTEYFAPKDGKTGEINITRNTYSIHHYDGSWMPRSLKFKNKVKNIVGPKVTKSLIACKRDMKALLSSLGVFRKRK